ncbi:arsenic transporter [Nocardioides sp. ChNu-153]|uniref:SLC13 family permease n=1 Tax=unclassified Nocardioides TaxID=2615069 RepID=UPI002406E45F|nr:MULTISPECIES: SLC13 family permease [unclassified Nocardioides]MDF9716181.1 hypothetical protein [Nocardioides sp. ChNu-99]MDN7121571.1 arsenic transporter [Nocardioides sp. ChNu-153]
MTVLAVLAAGACLLAALALQGWRQLAVGVVAAVAVLAAGAVDLAAARATVADLGPVVGYLVAILLLAGLVERGGLFAWLGYAVAHRSRARPGRLLPLAVAAAAGVTVLLTLDATVVLLVPVLVVAARVLAVDPWPVDLAAVRLANSASILLPISNLTNLVAFEASGLSFARFTLLMAPAWVVVVGLELALLRAVARRSAGPASRSAPAADPAPAVTTPPAAAPRPDGPTVVVLVLALAAIVAGGQVHLDPVWPALAAAALLGARAVTTRRTGLRVAPATLLREAGLPFASFVLCWAVAVAALAEQGGADLLARLLPDGTGPVALVATALLATVVANVVNNLPATLLLVPLAAPLGAPAVLAVLVGVGVGAGATYAGSLANLLWLRNPAVDHPVDVGRRFHLAGLLATPVLVVAAALALAATVGLTGGGTG